MAAAIQIAYVTDRGLLRPSLLSLDSALAQIQGEITVHFVGFALDAAEQDAVRRVVGRRSHARLTLHALDPIWMRNARSPQSFITPVALGRMFLPRLVEGRVLYLDGDTLVLRDLAPLASLDLQGHVLAGVPDFLTVRRLARGQTDRLEPTRRVMGSSPLHGYINSGVLLIDAEGIRAQPEQQAAMEDMLAAQGFSNADQDRLNQIFRGDILLLDPAWNASWGRLRRQRADLARVSAGPLAAGDGGPAVLHFHGPNKPWKPLRISQLAKGGWALWRYHRARAEFGQRFPDLVP